MAKALRNLWSEKYTALDRQSSFWEDTIQHEPSPDLAGLAETFSNKVTSAFQNRQETDFNRFSCRRSLATVVWATNFCHDSWVWFCGFVFAFAFSFCPASTNGIVLSSILFLISSRKQISSILNECNWTLFPLWSFLENFALAKGQELLRFPFDDME